MGRLPLQDKQVWLKEQTQWVQLPAEAMQVLLLVILADLFRNMFVMQRTQQRQATTT